MIWERMAEGMGAAAWVAGFVVVIGLFLLVVGLIGLVLTYVFSEDDDEEGGGDDAGDGDRDGLDHIPEG